MNKTLIKNIGIGMVALGTVAIFLGGGDESYTLEIVAGVFIIIGAVMAFIKKVL